MNTLPPNQAPHSEGLLIYDKMLLQAEESGEITRLERLQALSRYITAELRADPLFEAMEPVEEARTILW